MVDRGVPSDEVSLIPLSRCVGEALLARQLLVAAAESCTGGLIGHLFTEIPGSSAWFLGSAGVYSNEAKEKVLGISRDDLERSGAVSYEVAQQMARGAIDLYSAHVAVAVTGIAGPSGGSPDKPVGLVHLHLSTRDGTERAERVVWQADRRGNKLLSARLALEMVLDYAASG